MPVLLSMMGRVRLRSSMEQSWQSRVRSWRVIQTSWQLLQLRTNTLQQQQQRRLRDMLVDHQEAYCRHMGERYPQTTTSYIQPELGSLRTVQVHTEHQW